MFIYFILLLLLSCDNKLTKKDDNNNVIKKINNVEKIDINKIKTSDKTNTVAIENINRNIEDCNDDIFYPPEEPDIIFPNHDYNLIIDDDDCECRDLFECTIDYCQKENRSCNFIPNNDLCNDDNIFCNGIEICDPNLGCIPSPPPCEDNIVCTIDQCDEDTKSCKHIPDNNLCQTPCQQGAICHPNIGCVGGVNLCNDNIDCTIDSCDENGNCINTPNDNLCEQTFCDPKTCVVDIGCHTAPGPCNDNIDCTIDTCDDNDRSCTFTPNDAFCINPDDFCTSFDSCNINQGCISGKDKVCNDNIPCTINDCINNTCVYVPNNASCQDGIFCNGEEICDPTIGCKLGNYVNCDDNVVCTDDSCNESEKRCDNIPILEVCEGLGSYCDGYYCDPALGGCASHEPPCILDDGIPCTTDLCVKDGVSSARCEHILDDTKCNTRCATGVCLSDGCHYSSRDDSKCQGIRKCSIATCGNTGQCEFNDNIDLDTFCPDPPDRGENVNCPKRCDISVGCIYPCNDNRTCSIDTCISVTFPEQCEYFVNDCSLDVACVGYPCTAFCPSENKDWPGTCQQIPVGLYCVPTACPLLDKVNTSSRFYELSSRVDISAWILSFEALALRSLRIILPERVLDKFFSK